MYALVDCNNFYASCERVFQPQFRTSPIVILSNNDGCVIARSNEAKALGIPMGAPEFQVRSLIDKHGVKVFSSNYPLYGDLSQRVMRLLSTATPDLEVYSIDEAFLRFEGMNIADYHSLGLALKKKVQRGVGIPISIGFAPTKALAKVANKIGKKYPERTAGVYVLDTEEKRIKALQWTKIEDVWGIGYRLSAKLPKYGIHTAYDFTLPTYDALIKRLMGVVGQRLQSELRGQSVLGLDAPQDKKSIATTRSFEAGISDFDGMRERISTYASICAEKLRRQKSSCHTLMVFMRTDKFSAKPGERYHFMTVENLPFASNSSLTLSQMAVQMAEKLYQPGLTYKKAGVMVMQLVPSEFRQLQLFDDENPKHHALMKAIDKCHLKWGERKIRIANQDLQRTWKMKQNHLSRKFTTDIHDIIQVQCR